MSGDKHILGIECLIVGKILLNASLEILDEQFIPQNPYGPWKTNTLYSRIHPIHRNAFSNATQNTETGFRWHPTAQMSPNTVFYVYNVMSGQTILYPVSPAYPVSGLSYISYLFLCR